MSIVIKKPPKTYAGELGVTEMNKNYIIIVQSIILIILIFLAYRLYVLERPAPEYDGIVAGNVFIPFVARIIDLDVTSGGFDSHRYTLTFEECSGIVIEIEVNASHNHSVDGVYSESGDVVYNLRASGDWEVNAVPNRTFWRKSDYTTAEIIISTPGHTNACGIELVQQTLEQSRFANM